MTFASVLAAIQEGHRATRDGWNGAGMWIALTPGSTIPTNGSRPLTGACAHIARHETAATITINPHIDLRAADGSVHVGWKPTSADMLATDWRVL